MNPLLGWQPKEVFAFRIDHEILEMNSLTEFTCPWNAAKQNS